MSGLAPGTAATMVTALVAAMVVAALAAVAPPASAGGTGGPVHGVAMHGEPKYPAGFTHFDYVNPEAPKGGAITVAVTGSFDSLNPFIVRGQPARPVLIGGSAIGGIAAIYDTLMVLSQDEIFSMYCLLCETVDIPADRRHVTFTLRTDARWHDGRPVTADDVIFSFNILREQGAPFYRSYYAGVATVERVGTRGVRFGFGDGANAELPLILGQLPVLPQHRLADRDFTATSLEPPTGSGPYRVARVEAGRRLVLERVPDYWAATHPVRRGMDNFDTITTDYFRDRTVAREAFRGGDLDIWEENSAGEWATGFDTPAARDGRLITAEFPHRRTVPIQGYGFNLRKPLFQDRRVRLALTQAFDFEWLNRHLFHDQYRRTDSYFDNTELAARGRLAAAGAEERRILEAWRDQLPPELFTDIFRPPVTDGSGARGVRANLRRATALLREAGWEIRNGVMTHRETGQPFTFELLLPGPDDERIALPFRRNLERLGIGATLRVVDSTRYQQRLNSFDFDMTPMIWGQSDSPGNEQREFWGSEVANTPGSLNYPGIADPVVDALIGLVVAAPDRDSLVQRTRALDRVLQWGHYLIPHFYTDVDRIARWDRFGRPDTTTRNGEIVAAWWLDPARDRALAQTRQGRTGPDR